MLAKISNCVQGSDDVTTYFDKLCKLWDKVNAMKKVRLCNSTSPCADCAETDKEEIAL